MCSCQLLYNHITIGYDTYVLHVPANSNAFISILTMIWLRNMFINPKVPGKLYTVY